MSVRVRRKMKYNGWANYDTWNVAMWITNDKPRYHQLVEYATTSKNPSYRGFVEYAELGKRKTDDGVGYLSDSVGYAELDEMVREHASDNT
jgi:hypothetical protein